MSEILEGLYASQKRTLSTRYLICIFKLELNFTSRVLQIPTLYRSDQLLSKFLIQFRTYKAVIVQSPMSANF